MNEFPFCTLIPPNGMEIMTNFLKFSMHFWMKDWIISDHF